MAASSPPVAAPIAGARVRAHATLLDTLLLWTLLLAPITKLYIEPLGRLVLSNALGVVFVIAFIADRAIRRDARATWPVRILAGFFLAFTAVYLAGYVALDEQLERIQFGKAFAVWMAHGGFMLCAAAHLSRGGLPLIERAVHWLLAGFAASAAWAVLQLAGLRLGADIDMAVMTRLPFGPENIGSIKHYGGGLWRTTGLTLDPNHLGVMMSAPIALALTWLRGNIRWVVVAVCAAGLLLSLSRSGMLGLGAALLVLAAHQRHLLLRTRVVGTVGGIAAAAVLATMLLVQLRPDLAQSLILGRFNLSGRGAQAHLDLYTLIPDMLERAPVFGNGLNSFALLFAEASGGREGFGPHSHYIRVVVETGIAGALLFAVFVAWLLWRLYAIGGLRAAGLAAALVGVLAGNLFYLTTQILYVDALYAVAAAAPALMAVRYHSAMTSSPASAPPAAPASVSGPGEPAPAGPPEAPPRLGAVMRYWWLVVAGALLGVIAALLAAGSSEERWQADTTAYLGQPVGRNGSPLNTIGANAATGIELATGNEAVQAAAKEAGVGAPRIRAGLSARAVQSPLASKLASPPSIIRVTMEDRDPDVAEAAAAAVGGYLVAQTSEYADARAGDIRREIAAYEQQIETLQEQRQQTVARGGTDAGVLLAMVNSTIFSAQAALADARAELATVREVEQGRILDEARARRVATAERTSSWIVAALVGALIGAGAALVLDARRRKQP